ncbi:MAG TPA: hypothetical protein VGI34_02980, partial [Candidatus Acidoferrales bacterium]
MPAAGWERRSRGGRRAEDRARKPILVSESGKALSQLLDLGARALLAAGFADRAGLWLSGSRSGEPGSGSVVEAKSGPIPEHWKLLDVSAPFLRAALESPDLLRVDMVADETTPQIGPIAGMQTVIWVPLHSGDRSIGLCMVGYAVTPENLDTDAIQVLANEIALAVQYHRNGPASELAAEELRAQLRISQAILGGIPAHSIFSQIARAARNCVGAEFLAVGAGNVASAAGGGWDGAAGWLAAVRQGNFTQIWRKVLKEGRKVETSGRAPVKLAGDSKELKQLNLDRVVAIPLEVRGTTGGVLMAGFSRSEYSGEEVS